MLPRIKAWHLADQRARVGCGMMAWIRDADKLFEHLPKRRPCSAANDRGGESPKVRQRAAL